MCGYSVWVGHHEFVCVLAYHGSEYDNNGWRNPWQNARGEAAKWRRHYMRRRYPIGDH